MSAPRCQVCGRLATHKVAEEVEVDPATLAVDKHGFTTELCCAHFGMIMGKVAQSWCNLGHPRAQLPPGILGN